MKCNHNHNGFSLVEVIVVLAIISLITSAFLAYTVNSRDKAVLAGQQQTAATIDHGIGDQYIGAWNFNDCNGQTAGDSSGNKNEGNLVAATWSSDSPFSSGCSMLFSGNQSVQIDVPNIPVENTARTVTFWIKPLDQHATMPLFSSGQGDCTSKMFSMKLNDGKLQFYGGCNTFTSTLSVPANEWSFVSVTYNGSNTLKISTHGKAESHIVGPLDTQLSSLFIGAETVDNGQSFRSYFKGLIDNVHFFSASI